MTEELVKYETALLAKDKGFKENVLQCYNNNKDLISTYELNNISCEGGLDYSDFLSDYNNQPDLEKYFESNLYSAPTQSILQKWLREKHNLHITINIGLPHNLPMMYYCNVIKFGLHHKSKFRSPFCNTYEESLEIGLVVALNLIAIER